MVGRHPHIVQLLGSSVEEASCKFFMIMQKCGPSLAHRLPEVLRMGEDILARFFREMLLGIAHVHSVHIAHRDVKPDNFLLGGMDFMTIQLCDFGLAAKLPKSGAMLTGRCGTTPYMSPEMVVKSGRHGLNTDVWSMAVTAYVLLYGTYPFVPSENTPDAMRVAIGCGTQEPKFQPVTPGSRSAQAEDFVRALLTYDRRSRLSSKEALSLPFVYCPKAERSWFAPSEQSPAKGRTVPGFHMTALASA